MAALLITVRDVCRFYDVEEQNAVTDINVFYSSHALPTSNVQVMQRCLKNTHVMWTQFALPDQTFGINQKYMPQ